MELSYYAIFQFNPDGICISFPDIPSCITCAYSEDEGIAMAKEALDLILYGMIPEELPKQTSKNEIIIMNNQKLFKITILMEIKDGRLFDPNVIDFE